VFELFAIFPHYGWRLQILRWGCRFRFSWLGDGADGLLNGAAWLDSGISLERRIPLKSHQVTFKMKPLPAADDSGSSLWPVTDWSGVGCVAEVVGKDADRLNQLLLRYQEPLKVYLLSTFPSLKAQAGEILQNFSEDRLLKEGWLGKADPDRGRFRDFLKTSLKNFVHDHLRKHSNAPVSLDELGVDFPVPERSAELFDLGWVRTILAEVLKRMEADCKGPGKDQPRRTRIWEVFRLRLLQPAFEGSEPFGYEALVNQCGIVSPADAQNMLATAKRIFTRHLQAVVAEYEKEGAAVRLEIGELKQFLSGLSKRKSA
jgi:hypothetical protein